MVCAVYVCMHLNKRKNKSIALVVHSPYMYRANVIVTAIIIIIIIIGVEPTHLRQITKKKKISRQCYIIVWMNDLSRFLFQFYFVDCCCCCSRLYSQYLVVREKQVILHCFTYVPTILFLFLLFCYFYRHIIFLRLF